MERSNERTSICYVDHWDIFVGNDFYQLPKSEKIVLFLSYIEFDDSNN
jgi:hypothetical protein